MHQTVNVIERIVEQNLGVYRASPSRLQEDVSQESQVASDYRGRLVYELLQNADDAMADSSTSSDSVAFLVTDDELWIANSGRALTDDDVLGLCGLGASSKVDVQGNRRASIGHKGLGFKSVLEVTDEPSVYSSTTSFKLGAGEARPSIEDLWTELALPKPKGVPAMRFPVAVAAESPRWSAYQANGFNTAFCFPFKDTLDLEHRTAVANLLLSLPLTSVLFLKHLERIAIRVEQGARVADRTWRVDRERWNPDTETWTAAQGLDGSGVYQVTVTDSNETEKFVLAHDEEVKIAGRRVGLSGPAWDGVELTEVSVAAPIRDGGTEIPEEWRRFHVFLPTAETSPYSLLVNGAFATDLSRRQVRVSEDADDYNAHLIRRAAGLVCSRLIPMVRRRGLEAVLRLLERTSGESDAGAGALLHRAITEELADVPLIPEEGGRELKLSEVVLPSALLDEDGAQFRRVLRDDATWDARAFPDATWCVGRWARIQADHGARELAPADTLSAAARCSDPLRSRSVDHESGGFEVDPLLEIATALWTRSGLTEREALEQQARIDPIFPIDRRDDRTLDRVVLGETPAFFPPQSARTAVALPDLRFMSHSLCWGALNKKERTDLLNDRMNAWASLFGVREFRFETVVQTAVLPALVLRPDAEASERLAGLQSLDAVATICRLAGRFAKPDRPLRYQRLQSDRALLNLSRLPVPCRGSDNEHKWIPAYRVYFGKDWIGKDSIEHLHRALPDDTDARFAYLAPPDDFFGRLEDPSQLAESGSPDDDEVDVDEDADEAIESSERDRWIASLSWIGVNQCLRPIHFHDVEDDATGWLTTKGLARPNGRAFASLGATWDEFAAELQSRVKRQHDLSHVVPYLYEAHDLDQIVPVANAAAEDATCTVARAFFEHLVRHWPRLAPFADCTVALVEHGKWPGARAKPQRALAEELADAGDNLWIHRLRSRSICPTRLGPRQPELTWRPSAELDRRFGRRGRTSAALLPVLDVADGSSSTAVRGISERLGIRGEPSPSTFTPGDALRLCRQLQSLFPGVIDPADLREVVKPVYRQVFELLSGQSFAADASLQAAPLLANTKHGPAFLPASEMLYASTPGIRERSGIAGAVPTFILEAEASAAAPLRTLFGMRFLEEALDWEPSPGEMSLDVAGIEAMRDGLRELVPTLLARIRTERSAPADARTLGRFVDNVEPVESLKLACSLDGKPVAGVADRPYFVRLGKAGDELQAFVVWDGSSGWPPSPESAQGLAMALADALGINLVETFLAFIQSDADQRRRLLDIAGGSGLLAEVTDELAGASSSPEESAAPPAPTAGDDDAMGETQAAQPDSAVPAAPPTPLLRFDELTIAGEPVVIEGSSPGVRPANGHRAGARDSANGAAGRRAAPGTDLNALDQLGMRIAMAYEVHRLRAAGQVDATVDLGGAGSSLVVDVHSPETIREAEEKSDAVAKVMADLEKRGVSRLYPGFDILTIADGRAQRLIELKSSGVDAQMQVMSWNEWKTAKSSEMRSRFWLYLVGNLRADLPHALPYVRAIHDPFGTLAATEVSDHQVRRAVQLRVREFKHAEHLDLGVAPASTSG